MREVGEQALNLYKSGKGYNVYTGPTQADLSSQTLQGMNGIMAATGGSAPGAAPITNASINANIPTAKVKDLIAKIAAKNAASQAPAPVATPSYIPPMLGSAAYGSGGNSVMGGGSPNGSGRYGPGGRQAERLNLQLLRQRLEANQRAANPLWRPGGSR